MERDAFFGHCYVVMLFGFHDINALLDLSLLFSCVLIHLAALAAALVIHQSNPRAPTPPPPPPSGISGGFDMKLAPYDGEFDAKRSPLDRSGLLIIYVVYIDAKFTFKARNSLSMKFESYTIEEKATTRQCGMMSLCLFRRSHVKRGFPATFF